MSWYQCLLQEHGITVDGVNYRYYPSAKDDEIMRAENDKSGWILIKVEGEGVKSLGLSNRTFLWVKFVACWQNLTLLVYLLIFSEPKSLLKM